MILAHEYKWMQAASAGGRDLMPLLFAYSYIPIYQEFSNEGSGVDVHLAFCCNLFFLLLFTFFRGKTFLIKIITVAE